MPYIFFKKIYFMLVVVEQNARKNCRWREFTRKVLRDNLRNEFFSTNTGSALKFRPIFPDHRIIGGRETDIRNHPHQLTFQLYASHICGASIINKKWAVTAGHCFG